MALKSENDRRHLVLVGVLGLMLVAAVVTYQRGESAGGVSLLEKKGESSVVSKVASTLQSKHSNKVADAKGVKEAALDIAQVISEGKHDEAKVKEVIHRSRTHHGTTSAAVNLNKDLALLHQEASNKKTKASASVVKGKKTSGLKQGMGKAVDAALDISHAGSKVKEARQEALAIEKVLADSKKIVASADTIERHSDKGNGSSVWNSFWGAKHSLVHRLAAEVGAAGKKGGKK